MIELIFVACLAASPTDCRENSLVFVGVSPYQCLLRAQVELAAWTGARPGWRIRKWSCKPLETRESKA